MQAAARLSIQHIQHAETTALHAVWRAFRAYHGVNPAQARTLWRSDDNDIRQTSKVYCDSIRLFPQNCRTVESIAITQILRMGQLGATRLNTLP
ncbi:MAG: hypothetical protein HY860_01250 [Chlamydiales bacterium]|nr:hypothetical protein [Chlamydiales bacterium]